MKRKNIKTQVKDIVEYWQTKVDETQLSIDWCDAHERCWRCADKTKLEKCHIIPNSLGGEETPSNFVLLCKYCHLENPNVLDPEIMWDWLIAYSASFYDTFWVSLGFEEYYKIYGEHFEEQVDISNENFKFLLKKHIDNSRRHFGVNHLNKATVAGILKMIYKEIYSDKEYQHSS